MCLTFFDGLLVSTRKSFWLIVIKHELTWLGNEAVANTSNVLFQIKDLISTFPQVQKIIPTFFWYIQYSTSFNSLEKQNYMQYLIHRETFSYRSQSYW